MFHHTLYAIRYTIYATTNRRFLSLLAILLMLVWSSASVATAQSSSAPPTSASTTAGSGTTAAAPTSNPPTSAVTDPDTLRALGTVPANQPTVEQFRQQGLLSNITSPKCLSEGKCSLCDMVQVGVNVGNFILAIAGAIALFFGAWAAFGFVTTRGDEEKIKEARTTMWNALAGIVLVLLAWQLVAVILLILTGNGNPFRDVCA